MALKCVAGRCQGMHEKHGLGKKRLASSARVVACARMQVRTWERQLENTVWHSEDRWLRHDKRLTRGEQRIMGGNDCRTVELLATVTKMSLTNVDI